MKNLLGGHKVADAMRHDFAQVPGEITIQELVDRTLLPSGARCAIVMAPHGPAGLVTLTAIRELPRQEWPTTAVARIMVPFQNLATTQPNAVLWSALEKMGRDGVNQLPVLEGNGIVGILSREDVLHYLSALQAFAA
jgi:predicted transcriptional regulator